MKYYYQKKSGKWKSVDSIWKLRCVCSIMGTKTWCIADCPLAKKHEKPEECEEHKIRRGVKELFWLLTGLISIKMYIYLTVNINIWTYQELEGVSNGMVAKFRIAIITQEYRWKFASPDSIETGSIERQLPNLLNNVSGFENAKGIIAVGAASQEGNVSQEIARADRRADNVLLILRTHELSEEKELYKLNLGQYQSKNQSKTVNETSVQRRVIIIAVLNSDPRMTFEEFKEALHKALDKSELKVTIQRKTYSNFDLQRMN